MAGGAPDLLVVGGGVWGTWTALHDHRLPIERKAEA